MKQLIVVLAISLFLLPSCQSMETVTVIPNPFAVTPSRLPMILTLTPILIQQTIPATLSPTSSQTPSLTIEPSAVPSATYTPPPTFTETFTPSPTPTVPFFSSPTITATSQILAIQLLGCDTGIDVTHGMGEVTNAYAVLINATGPDLTSVCVTLSSADENRLHPDKIICIPSLPGGYRVTLKLTIDTTFQENKIMDFLVNTNEGITITEGGLACQEIGINKPAPGILNVVQPIP